MQTQISAPHVEANVDAKVNINSHSKAAGSALSLKAQRTQLTHSTPTIEPHPTRPPHARAGRRQRAPLELAH
eukprot:1073118-Pleurochrysis_carterae.AAC.2